VFSPCFSYYPNLKKPIHAEFISCMSAGKVPLHHSSSSVRELPASPAVFLIISAKTERLLYVGLSMRTVLGHDEAAFLGADWKSVARIVVPEYRELFSTAVGQYLLRLNSYPLLTRLTTVSGAKVDCEIGSTGLLSGQDDDCVITCRFGSGRSEKGQPRPAAGAVPARDNGPHADARRDIARELHETAAQELFLCKGKLVALRGASGEKQRARFLSEALGYLDQSTTSFRGVLSSAAMTPAPDLRSAVAGAVHWARETYGLKVSQRVAAELPWLEAAARDLVASTARELLTNVFKHSGQKFSRVTFCSEGGGVRLDVVDHGAGMRGDSPANPPGPGSNGSGFGLSGIRDRAARIGGRLEVESSAAKGTRVSLVLPGGGSQ
jgi:signal transduction histidine kinase